MCIFHKTPPATPNPNFLSRPPSLLSLLSPPPLPAPPAAVCPSLLSPPAHSAAAPCPRWPDPLAKCHRPELKPSGEHEPARRICSSTIHQIGSSGANCELHMSIHGLIEERIVVAIVADVVESMNYGCFVLTLSSASASEGGLDSHTGINHILLMNSYFKVNGVLEMLERKACRGPSSCEKILPM
ncbi:unnamed protein product [Urochloa humidicola]